LPAEAHDTDLTVAVIPVLARAAGLAVADGTAGAIDTVIAVIAAPATRRVLRIRTPAQ
jgi:hypothetical protein